MDIRTTLILVGLVIVVAVVWMFTSPAEAPSAAPEEEEAAKESFFFDPQPDSESLVRVEVERPGEPKIVFVRDESGDGPTRDNWKVVEPIEIPAEGFRVRGLTSALTGLKTRDSFAPGAAGKVGAEDAGLAPPRLTVTMIDEDDKTFAVEIGNKAVLSRDTYVRRVGEMEIHVAQRDLSPHVKNSLDDYRTKQLVRFQISDVSRVHIQYDGRTCDLSKQDGEWVINEPFRAFALGEKVRSSLLSPLSSLRVQEFVEDNPQSLDRYGLDTPMMRVSVTTETREEAEPENDDAEAGEPEVKVTTETHELLIGASAGLEGDQRYAFSDASPSVVTINQSDIDKFVPKPAELRDPQVVRITAADATELTLRVDGNEATLINEQGRWQGEGDLDRIEPAAVVDVLEALEDLQAVSTIEQPESPAKYGLDNPRATLIVKARGQIAPVTLHVGSETASGMNAYVQRAGDEAVVVVSAAQADRLAITPLSLRAREIYSFSPNQIETMRIARDQRTYELSRSGGRWQLQQPADAPVAGGNAQSIAMDLSRLRAKRVVGKGDDAAYGLDSPDVTIEFVRAEQPPADNQPAEAPPAAIEATLLVSQHGDSIYARKHDGAYIFELDESVYETFTAELIDPRVFDFSGGDVLRVTVDDGDETPLILTKQSDEWEYTPDPFVKIDQEESRKLVAGIASLRAEEYIVYSGGDLAAAGLADPAATVVIVLRDGREIEMLLGQVVAPGLRKAAIPAEGRIFLIEEADATNLLRELDAYIAEEEPEEPASRAPGPPMRGMPRRP